MYVAKTSNLINDFAAVKEFQNKRKTNFIGKPRQKSQSFPEFIMHYVSHRIFVRQRKDDEIIGYAEFAHFPKIDALPRDCWMDWLKSHYCYSKHLSEGNTLFLNYFLYSPLHTPELLSFTLREVFFRDHRKQYVLIVEFPKQERKSRIRVENNPNYNFLKGLSHVIYPRIYNITHCKNTQKIHIINRDQVIDKMHYRLALPEDNDDVVAVIDVERSDIRQEFGDFYIAEELIRQQLRKDESSFFIVTEVHHKTVGFIWLNKNLDIRKLINNFELQIFGNLVKYSPLQRNGYQIIRTKGIRQKLQKNLFTEQAIQGILDNNEFSGPESLPSNRSFTDDMCVFPNLCGIINSKRYHLQEELLQIMKMIMNTLITPAYYTQNYDKSFIFRYNIPGDDNGNGQSEPILNAFCLQLFALTHSYDKRRLARFLTTGFCAYPDRDYCILSIPKSAKITEGLHELLKHFVMVLPLPHCKIDDYLFVTHRSSVYGEITVADVREQDAAEIENMLLMGKNFKRRVTRYSIGTSSKQEFVSEPEMVKNIINEVLENKFSEYKVLTIRCGDSSKPIDDNVIVGFVILRQFYDLHLLSDHFIIPKTPVYGNFVRSEVVILKLQPLYHAQSDQIFREIGRHVDIYDFYYFAPNMFTHKRITNDLISKMQPVEPIHIKMNYKYIKATDSDLNAPNHLLGLNLKADSFSVFTMNMKPTRFFGKSNPIIILGFSHECRAFLRQLIFNFNKLESKTSYCCVPLVKIIVIVKPGVDEAEYDKELRCYKCGDQSNCWIHYRNSSEYLRDTIERMDIRVWVNFIHTKVNRIDRKKNLIFLEDECELYYDTLLICNSKHFGLDTNVPDTKLPHNYAEINNRFDKFLMYYRIKYIREHAVPTQIVVYGSHIRTFEFINFLLNHGIDAKYITLVMPFELTERELHLKYNIPYADLNIEYILQQMIEDLGVKYYDRMNFISWECYRIDNSSISQVMFESFPEKIKLSLDCDLFVNYYEYHKLDTDTLNLLRAADVEVDGRLVLVDANYRTNDPNIFAFGKIVQRRTKPNFQYRLVSPIDAAKKILQILGLNINPDKDIGARYRRPTYFQAQLPMGYYFVKVTLPKSYLAGHLSNEYSTRLVTYKDYTFCRVRLNEHSIVEEFVCVTQQRIPFDFLIYFVGKHEALLNDLQVRWYLKEIDNFLDFFQEPWTELIMHRNFHLLRAAIKDIALETAQAVMTDEVDIHRDIRKCVMKRFAADNGTTKEVEQTFLSYLRKYREEFSPGFFAMPEDFKGDGK